MKRIGICTGGGDAPGLNAVIRAAVLTAAGHGIEVFGLRDSLRALLCPQDYPDGPTVRLTAAEVRGVTRLGGTILGSTNQHVPHEYPCVQPDGSIVAQDRTPFVVGELRRLGLDALISIGGDGSMGIAARIAALGFPVIGVPKTIDNDLDGTVVTFGFDTAVEFATQCIDRLHSTAHAHGRVMIVEVMGRYAGWIALEAGLAGTADIILLPEIPYDFPKVLAKLQERRKSRGFSLVVVAEGARPLGDDFSRGEQGRLGGAAEKLMASIRAASELDPRHVVLGHLLRGGNPTARDRNYALRFGAAAVRALLLGHTAEMVALDPPDVRYVPLQEATRRMKVVPLDCDSILTARSLGTCLGDN